MKRKMMYLAAATAFVQLATAIQPAVAQQKKSASAAKEAPAAMSAQDQKSMTPQQALDKLKSGNERFVSGKEIDRDYSRQVAATANGQYPYAIVLSCVDSRTSSEIIFDQGIGDIFNARIAGNFVNTDILGSMEFACKVAGSKVILVVGHSACGAVKGACDHVEMGNLTNVMNELKPAVEATAGYDNNRNSKNQDFVEAVAKQNVLLAISEIREKSPILKEMESKGEIIIAGAMYDITTGKVTFY